MSDNKLVIKDDHKITIKTVANHVTDRLRQEIIDGVYKIGEHITVKNIVNKYGVSEMPVREAFQCLKGEGLLEVQQYKGARVLSINVRDASNIYDIRRMMELLIMSEVVTKEYDEHFIEELRRINSLFDLCQSKEEMNIQYQDVNNQFHYYMFSLCDNNRAKDMYVFYSGLLKALKKRYPNEIDEMKQAIAEHEEIIYSLSKRDQVKLEKVLTQHALRAKNELIRKMKISE
ncbi:GntR family transcriptional regulator [Alkalihalobacillus oceani]|uniref:GntR family transcriptional regulator n=1 Tax=Halalkalibacter oceani TaxID=1653776 RepID=A0A9X2ILX5_9BACI|nr:GntR family transcriptional regulator [Halalkalibacter oceani]MCM3712475.1 GntR family transcriptional regulator [Halalkalibacter oceani]